MGRLELEEFAGVLPALLLARLHLGHQLLALLLPVSQLLLQDPLLFVQRLATAAGLQDNTEALFNTGRSKQEAGTAQQHYTITTISSDFTLGSAWLLTV